MIYEQEDDLPRILTVTLYGGEPPVGRDCSIAGTMWSIVGVVPDGTGWAVELVKLPDGPENAKPRQRG